MFSKDQRPKSDAAPSAGGFGGASASLPATPSIISADLHIVGNLKSNSDIQIDGQIDGDVTSRAVTVGEGAEVNGTVTGDLVRVSGRLSGEIRANSVVIAKSAVVSGDIAHKNLEIEAGASLEGGIRRLEGDPLAKAESKKGAKTASVTPLSEGAGTGKGGNGKDTAGAAAENTAAL